MMRGLTEEQAARAGKDTASGYIDGFQGATGLIPLKVEVYSLNSDRPFQMYECEHVTDGTYPIETAIPVGSHTNMTLCAHCWQHVRGMAAEELINQAFGRYKKSKGGPKRLGRDILKWLVDGLNRCVVYYLPWWLFRRELYLHLFSWSMALDSEEMSER